jgi:biotin transport system substrate-specific component
LSVIYASGVVWLAFFAQSETSRAIGLDEALTDGLFPFILADVGKLVIAAAVVPGLWRLFGRAA